MKKEKIGFTIGKFAPLHKGHQLVIETGLKEMDKFFVVIYETNLLNIDLETRAKWIKKLYPKVKIYFAENPPKQYGLDNVSVDIQMKYLEKIIKYEKPTHFYSSELYGKCVAKYLNIVDRQVDNKREKFNISGTQLREDLESNKNWVENIVYQDCKNKFKNN